MANICVLQFELRAPQLSQKPFLWYLLNKWGVGCVRAV